MLEALRSEVERRLRDRNHLGLINGMALAVARDFGIAFGEYVAQPAGALPLAKGDEERVLVLHGDPGKR